MIVGVIQQFSLISSVKTLSKPSVSLWTGLRFINKWSAAVQFFSLHSFCVCLYKNCVCTLMSSHQTFLCLRFMMTASNQRFTLGVSSTLHHYYVCHSLTCLIYWKKYILDLCLHWKWNLICTRIFYILFRSRRAEIMHGLCPPKLGMLTLLTSHCSSFLGDVNTYASGR